MGLMYIFPVNKNEIDHVEIKADQTIILKTYGLPFIFWGYLAASLIVVASMWMASKSSLEKLLSYQDTSLVALGLLVKYTLLITPVILLGFFFYEKQIQKSGNKLKLVFKIFYIPVWHKTIQLEAPDALSVNHFMDSPNMAKIYNKTELKAFENRGYFELKGKCEGKDVLIDRHSRKADLLKLKDLLTMH